MNVMGFFFPNGSVKLHFAQKTCADPVHGQTNLFLLTNLSGNTQRPINSNPVGLPAVPTQRFTTHAEELDGFKFMWVLIPFVIQVERFQGGVALPMSIHLCWAALAEELSWGVWLMDEDSMARLDAEYFQLFSYPPSSLSSAWVAEQLQKGLQVTFRSVVTDFGLSWMVIVRSLASHTWAADVWVVVLPVLPGHNPSCQSQLSALCLFC